MENANEPASPVVVYGPHEDETYFTGLTKREYFAAHAPFTIDDARKLHGGGHEMTKLVEMRIEYANRMMAALNCPEDLVTCPDCAGVGIKKRVTCTRCDGYGMVPA